MLKETINNNNCDSYGSIDVNNINLWRNTKNLTSSRACRNQLVFVLLLLFTSAFCIIFAIYPLKQRLPNKIQEIDPNECETHICLYDESDISLTNIRISLLESHASTIQESSRFAFINFQYFQQSPDSLSITHPDGMVITLPLKSYRNDGLYYFENDIEDRFLISIDFENNIIEGFASCQGQKFELHSIGDTQFHLMIEKNWIQTNTDWCGIGDINTHYDNLIDIDDNDADTDNNNDEYQRNYAIWLNQNNIITNHIELDGLIINKEILSDEEDDNLFVVEPLCSDQSQYDSNVYCLYPSSTNSWQQFDDLSFYTFNSINSEWTELTDFALDLADSTINIPKSMCVITDNEIYTFSVNPIDAMVNIYSFTTSWRLHHYTPIINGDIDKVEIKSVFIDNVLYFSINEYDPTGIYTVYHYTDDIFSIFDTKLKSEVPIYSHCLTSHSNQLLTYYIDYGHNLWAYYDGLTYNLDFNIANDIDVNHFDCISTEIGIIISWNFESNVYYVQLSPNDFQTIISYSTIPWNMESFQLISLKNNVENDYKTVSVYYSNDIISNYLPDTTSITMDIESLLSLSNIFYSINNKYDSMMKLETIALYQNNDNIDTFSSYQGESNINILLVDTMIDEEEIGYSQCDPNDQSFAVVQYTAF